MTITVYREVIMRMVQMVFKYKEMVASLYMSLCRFSQTHGQNPAIHSNPVSFKNPLNLAENDSRGIKKTVKSLIINGKVASLSQYN